MEKGALIMMLSTMGIVAGFTFFFFYKMMTVKPKVDSDEDSYSENDTENK